MRTKTLLLLIAIITMPLLSQAQTEQREQTPQYAVFSYEEVLRSMPGYNSAQVTLREIRTQYEAEIKRTEDDFNSKYEDFLEVQGTLASNIRDKRQGELLEMMQKGAAFKDEAKRLLAKAEDDLLAPVRSQIADALASLAKEKGYAFVLNTDNNAVPYVDADKCEDITEALCKRLTEDE